MTTERDLEVRSAAVVLPCRDLDATVAFFADRLGFRLDSIFPADDPQVAVLSGHGTRLRLERTRTGDPGVLRIQCAHPPVANGVERLTAPNGTLVELVDARAAVVVPALRSEYVLTRANDHADWHTGRAGMKYRDLIPGRQGGRFIASHIRIPDGGEVPDYVHFHEVRFQLIYCRHGAVRVVYEDQGEPFWMKAGDCVLQPPRIRHRVLECAPGLEVIELGCPAEHATHADHTIDLPTGAVLHDRDFDGQRFVHHVAADAEWHAWLSAGFEYRDTGIQAATRGLASVVVARSLSDGAAAVLDTRDAELLFGFLLHGTATLQSAASDRDEAIRAGDCFVLPAEDSSRLSAGGRDCELLVVRIPAG